jgi:hypothetical protein
MLNRIGTAIISVADTVADGIGWALLFYLRVTNPKYVVTAFLVVNVVATLVAACFTVALVGGPAPAAPFPLIGQRLLKCSPSEPAADAMARRPWRASSMLVLIGYLPPVNNGQHPILIEISLYQRHLQPPGVVLVAQVEVVGLHHAGERPRPPGTFLPTLG